MGTLSPARPRRATPSRAQSREPLGRFTDEEGLERELIRRDGAEGTTLVIDRPVGSGCDERLVAHLSADEPMQNARIVASLYLEDETGRHCRLLTAEDLTATPFANSVARPAAGSCEVSTARAAELTDSDGAVYRIAVAPSASGLPQLRWLRQLGGAGVTSTVVSVRDVIGVFETYEPIREITEEALAEHRQHRRLSTAVLRAELERVLESPIVLNRRLREAVLERVEHHGLTLSQIAIRCGRVKRDRRGNESGETSWLARRIGLLAEGGKDAPTPWVSSEVLALIAREGLGVCPREVEAG